MPSNDGNFFTYNKLTYTEVLTADIFRQWVDSLKTYCPVTPRSYVIDPRILEGIRAMFRLGPNEPVTEEQYGYYLGAWGHKLYIYSDWF